MFIINYLIKNRVQNASFDYEQVRSGPPNILYSLLNSNFHEGVYSSDLLKYCFSYISDRLILIYFSYLKGC